MTGTSNLLRTLLIYSLVLPLALIIGYAMATPMDFTTWVLLGLVLALIGTPLALKWHRPLLFMSWNMTAVIFLLPGRPQLWLVAAALSLTVSLVERALFRDSRFLRVPSVLFPLIFLAIVIALTAKLRGGIGLASMGDSAIGGRRYVTMFVAMAGFLAMIAKAIPDEKARTYLKFFFLVPILNMTGTLVNLVNPSFYWIFLFFPVERLPGDEARGIFRLTGLTLGGVSVLFYFLATRGVRGILESRTLWEKAVPIAAVAISMLGGYRSFFILMLLTVAILFYLEGLLRSKYFFPLLVAGLLVSVLMVPFASKLPVPIQRAISILPVEVDQQVRLDAQASTEWRLRLWRELLPEVPKYFWLGKGLAIEKQEFILTRDVTAGDSSRSTENFSITGDYHNGPLTVLIPFGVWGAIGWLWFLYAAGRVLHRNYVYGSDRLKTVNTFLLSYFWAKTILFFVVFGSFHTDLASFLGVLGLGVALNGGIANPQSAPEALRSQLSPASRPRRIVNV